MHFSLSSVLCRGFLFVSVFYFSCDAVYISDWVWILFLDSGQPFVLHNIQQYVWPLSSRCQELSFPSSDSPGCNNQKYLQTLPNFPGKWVVALAENHGSNGVVSATSFFSLPHNLQPWLPGVLLACGYKQLISTTFASILVACTN
jgi:hypothetical protein